MYLKSERKARISEETMRVKSSGTSLNQPHLCKYKTDRETNLQNNCYKKKKKNMTESASNVASVVVQIITKNYCFFLQIQEMNFHLQTDFGKSHLKMKQILCKHITVSERQSELTISLPLSGIPLTTKSSKSLPFFPQK